MALNKAYIMTLAPGPNGCPIIPGAYEVLPVGPDMCLGMGPPKKISEGPREVWAAAILHNAAIDQWVVIADGDDPNVWTTIDPEGVGVKPKDLLGYRFWSIDCEYDDWESKKIKNTKHMSYAVGEVPDWQSPQTLEVEGPAEDGTTTTYVATVTKAKPSVHKNIAGYDLTTDVEQDSEDIEDTLLINERIR